MNLYGLIGYPLGHSFSKQYFTEKFVKENLVNCHFESFPIESIDQLPDLLDDNKNLKGLSVTIPYKESVLKYVDELSKEVEFIGASNSIKIKNQRLIAYNTDIIGFERSFVKMLKPQHTKALILGTGGASKAVQYVFKKLGISYLIVTRNIDLKSEEINYENIDALIMQEYFIIVNASPVGTYPNQDFSPQIPYQLLTSKHYLFDLVYKPEKTLFLKKGEAQGAQIKNGFEMLLIQAAASWQIWNEDGI